MSMDSIQAELSNCTDDRRRSSYLSVKSLYLGRKSLESLYNSCVSMSISIPSNGSSADSVDIEEIHSNNRQLFEVLTTRLTAFLYFTETLLEEPVEYYKASIKELEEIKESISQSQSLEDSNCVETGKVLQQISDLMVLYSNELKKLEESRTEISQMDEEEEELNKRLTDIERKLGNISLETENAITSCKCVCF